MTDAVSNSVSRKVVLDNARNALKSGSISHLKTALLLLPQSGKKAAKLRLEITKILDKPLDPTLAEFASDGPSVVMTSDGTRYQCNLGDTGQSAFFLARRLGTSLIITINTAHPTTLHHGGIQILSNETLLLVLAAWAQYELEQSNAKKQLAASDARSDWGRMLIRLSRTAPDFSVG